MGGLLLFLGLASTVLLTSVVDLPREVSFALAFAFGILPATLGAAIAWSGWRAAQAGRARSADRLADVKEQIVWRAIAQGGRITAAEAAAQSGLPETQIEHALIALVADGRAAVEPGAEGTIVYRIDSPV